MAQILTFIALDPTKITCRPVRTILIFFLLVVRLSRWSHVDPSGRGRAFLGSLLLLLSLAVFLLFPPSFCDQLRVVRTGRSYQNRWVWAPNLRFLQSWVFWSLTLGRKSVHQLIAPVALLIEVLAGVDLYFGFGLGSGCLFDQGVPTVQALAFFIKS